MGIFWVSLSRLSYEACRPGGTRWRFSLKYVTKVYANTIWSSVLVGILAEPAEVAIRSPHVLLN